MRTSHERIELHLHQAAADVTDVIQLWGNYNVTKKDCQKLIFRYFLLVFLLWCFIQADKHGKPAEKYEFIRGSSGGSSSP